MAPTSQAPVWYVARNGQQQGPLPEAELLRRHAAGEIAPTDLVWCAGWPNWRSAADVFAAPAAAPAPAPMAPQAPAASAQRETTAAAKPAPASGMARVPVKLIAMALGAAAAAAVALYQFRTPEAAPATDTAATDAASPPATAAAPSGTAPAPTPATPGERPTFIARTDAEPVSKCLLSGGEAYTYIAFDHTRADYDTPPPSPKGLCSLIQNTWMLDIAKIAQTDNLPLENAHTQEIDQVFPMSEGRRTADALAPAIKRVARLARYTSASYLCNNGDAATGEARAAIAKGFANCKASATTVCPNPRQQAFIAMAYGFIDGLLSGRATIKDDEGKDVAVVPKPADCTDEKNATIKSNLGGAIAAVEKSGG